MLKALRDSFREMVDSTKVLLTALLLLVLLCLAAGFIKFLAD